MPVLSAKQLTAISTEILHAAGALPEEARTVAEALVEANLEGHDSHGVVRIPEYVRGIEEKLVHVGAQLRVVKEAHGFAVIDGDWGWGQIIGKKAMEIAIRKAADTGTATISVYQCCHLGRIGDYPLMAARKGMAALMFVNTHGGGKLVAPWGGRERRLSANPISIAVPRSSGRPILVDISTCAIAGGKVTIARNSGKPVPQGCIIDAAGRASTNPADFYGPPEGALLPFGGHKGFVLSLLTDILAGALSGAGCSRSTAQRIANSFLAIVIDINQFRDLSAFNQDVDELVEYVKTSKLASGFTEILIPGEPELRCRDQREKHGIPVDEKTWSETLAVAQRYGVSISKPA